mmetsp:Transcript_13135/g.18225  ORF Transcript_13135/g.18225 Transcript_13135/m.18225 type:complete len:138 (-) Transcript_13135:130-543(-)
MSDVKQEKKQKTLAEAHEEKEEELSCQEQTAICWADTKVFCHHKEGDEDIYCGNNCTAWGWLLLFFLCLYCFNTAFFAILLNFEVNFGTGVLWGYFTIFMIFVAILGVVIYLGHQQHLVREETIRAERAKLDADEKV